MRAHLATRRDAALFPKLTHSAANNHNKINKTWTEGFFFFNTSGKEDSGSRVVDRRATERVREIFISLLMCLRVC